MKTFKSFREQLELQEAKKCSECGCDPMNPKEGCDCNHKAMAEEYSNAHYQDGKTTVKVKSTGATGKVISRHRQDGEIHYTVDHGGDKTSKHPGSNLKVHESKMDGVADGALEGDKHMCATKIFKEGFGEGVPIKGDHADPDEFGNISWYTTMFDHGIETVEVQEEGVKILAQEAHMNHKKKAYK